ncbi:MAG: peptidyl-prolyl cis-trans isomerase [Alphaproteobacteria bacterium]|nr:peptidyl-prolyl cis-trans isomerase [Alphaproteobacteria bacterium]
MKKRLLGFVITTVAIVVVAVASFVSFKVYNANAGASKGVAAYVNNEPIQINDIKQSYEDHQQIKEKVPFEEFYEKTLDVFINSRLVYQASKTAKIEETPEFKRQLVTVKEDLARKLYLEKIVEEKVTNLEIKKLYDEYLSKFESQKEVSAKHILTDSEEKAKEIINKLKKGEDFDKLASENSLDQAVELGYFTKEMMVPEFSEAAFAMNKGEYSKTPVKTSFGYHIIWVNDARASQPIPLTEIEPQLKNMVTQKVVEELFNNLRTSAKIEKYSLEGEKITN